jgi:hypothetical protein
MYLFFGWQKGFYTVDMDISILAAVAMAGVNRILHHCKAVFYQQFTEA